MENFKGVDVGFVNVNGTVIVLLHCLYSAFLFYIDLKIKNKKTLCDPFKETNSNTSQWGIYCTGSCPLCQILSFPLDCCYIVLIVFEEAPPNFP